MYLYTYTIETLARAIDRKSEALSIVAKTDTHTHTHTHIVTGIIP